MTISIGSPHNSGPPDERTQLPYPPGFDAHHYLEAAPGRDGFPEPYDNGLRRVPATDRGYLFRQGILTTAFIVAVAYYGVWRFAMFADLGYFGKGFVVVEAILALVFFVATLAMAKRSQTATAPPLPDLTLDVIIPVSGQPIDAVEQTITSVLAMTWAHRLVVCNDGPGADGDDWRAIRSACHHRGIRCLTRFGEAPNQAATLNHALSTLSGDVVLVVEPHRTIVPDAAERMIGWFGDPNIAFVCGPDRITPGSKDPIPWPNAPFTRSWQPSRDGSGLAYATGAAMYRRDYLDDVGGFVAGSNPSLFTAKKLHTSGYYSVYEPEPIATTSGPANSDEALESLHRAAIEALSTKPRNGGARKVPRNVRTTYRLTSMYFPALVFVLVAALGPAVRIFSGEPFFVADSARQVAYRAIPLLVVVAATVISWGGLLGGIRWFRSVLFAQSAMGIFGWASGRTGYGAANDRGRQQGRESGRLLLIASVVPGALLASVVVGLFDSRPGGSSVAIAIAAALLVVGGGPLLHGDSAGFPFLRWSMYLFCLAGGAAAIATTYFSWHPPQGLLASVAPPPEIWQPPDQDDVANDSDAPDPDFALDAGVESNESIPGTPELDLDGSGADTTSTDTQPEADAPGQADANGGADETLPPDIDPPAPGPVDHAGTLLASDGIYVGLTAPDPPSGWDDVVTWPAQAVQPQILHWYQSWASPPAEFRNDLTSAAQNANMTPLISWQAWAPPQGLTIATATQPQFELSRIIAGDYDTYIDSWARAAAAYEAPILLRPFQDPNGSWYPWSVGANNNTAKQYRRAWRRVVNRFAAAGADNVGFVWSIAPVQGTGGPDPIEAYYPGDKFVDWVAVSGFVWDDYGSWADTADIPTVFSESYTALQERGKPIMFIDVGATQGPEAPVSWVGDAMRYFSGLSDLRAVVWFDRAWSDQRDATLSTEQRRDLADAVDEVDATVSEGGAAAEGLTRFLPQPAIGEGSTASE